MSGARRGIAADTARRNNRWGLMSERVREGTECGVWRSDLPLGPSGSGRCGRGRQASTAERGWSALRHVTGPVLPHDLRVRVAESVVDTPSAAWRRNRTRTLGNVKRRQRRCLPRRAAGEAGGVQRVDGRQVVWELAVRPVLSGNGTGAGEADQKVVKQREALVMRGTAIEERLTSVGIPRGKPRRVSGEHAPATARAHNGHWCGARPRG